MQDFTHVPLMMNIEQQLSMQLTNRVCKDGFQVSIRPRRGVVSLSPGIYRNVLVLTGRPGLLNQFTYWYVDIYVYINGYLDLVPDDVCIEASLKVQGD